MICTIRIKGQINIDQEISETLERLKLKRKYACVLLPENKEIAGMLKKVGDCVAYGKISDEMRKKLEETRGEKGKEFFRLNPPKGGLNTKKHFPKGALGDNGEKINELLGRMI